MRCHKCGVVTETEDIFCRKCSSRIRFDKTENLCSCGQKLGEEDKFCFRCGKQIIPSFSLLEKDRSRF